MQHQVLTDREKRGILAEQRLVRAVFHDRRRPFWIRAAVITRGKVELCGVDVLMYIYFPGEWRVRPVPIQVKSSVAAAREFLEVHPDLAEDIMVLVINELVSDEKLLRILYEKLERIRDGPKRFDALLADLLVQPLSERGEKRHERWLQEEMVRQATASEEDLFDPPPTIVLTESDVILVRKKSRPVVDAILRALRVR